MGAGHIGSILARDLCGLRHTVWIANSRGPETLSDVERDTGAVPVSVSRAAEDVDLLVIAIPLHKVPSLPKDLLSRLPLTSPVIDTTNYYPPVSGRIPEIDGGVTEAEWVSGCIGRPVIKAFNNIYADSLSRGGLPKGAPNRIALPVTGDDVEQKRIVMALIDAIGFDALDAGPLSESWCYQPGTPAYCSDPSLEQLPGLLQRADRHKAPLLRDRAAKMFGKVLLEHPQQEMVRVLRLSLGLDLWKPKSWLALAGLLFAIARFKLGL